MCDLTSFVVILLVIMCTVGIGEVFSQALRVRIGIVLGFRQFRRKPAHDTTCRKRYGKSVEPNFIGSCMRHLLYQKAWHEGPGSYRSAVSKMPKESLTIGKIKV